MIRRISFSFYPSHFLFSYQSDKYSQPTATSEAVTVTLSDATFDVKQNTLNKFTMNFGAPVKSLTTDNVEVIRLLEAGSAVYEYPQVVKSVKLASDGLSATVEMFYNFQNNVNYAIKVTGFDDYTMTASAGTPVSMTISSNQDSISPFVTALTQTKLYPHLYDVNGVDVTTGGEVILYNAKTLSNDGSYYVAGDIIWFAKSGLSATVVAEYQSNRFENGIQVGNIPVEFDFYSVDATPVTFKGVVDATVTSFGNDKTLSLPMEDVAFLKVKVAASQGDPVEITANEAPFLNGRISFEETTPDVLMIDKSNMKLIPVQKGTARVIVNYEVPDSTSNYVPTPVGVVTITVTEKRALSTVTVNNAVTTVGTETNYNTATVKLTAKDQYGAPVGITSVAISAANDVANNVIAGVSWDPANPDTITLNGAELAGAIVGNNNAIQLTYKATVNGSKEVSFSVLVKTKIDNPNAYYIGIETSGNYGSGDVARTVDSKNAKFATFTVYTMNNTIKVGTQAVTLYPGNINDAVKDAYYYKVTKDGRDITNVVTPNANGATINFSGTDPITNGAVSGSAVKYDLGAGTYVFSLYKCSIIGGTPVMSPQGNQTLVTTCNTGSYSAAIKVADRVAVVDPASIFACFEIKNTKGNNAGTPYFVDYTEGTEHVFVKSITFYELMEDGVYAAYTVNVGVSLKK